MLVLDKVVLAKIVERLSRKMGGKVPGAHLQLIPSLLDLRQDELGVERLAKATVEDMIAVVES